MSLSDTHYVDGEVEAALKEHFGADSVERADGARQLFSVFFDATGCFLIEIVAVGGGVDMVNPEANRDALIRNEHAAHAA